MLRRHGFYGAINGLFLVSGAYEYADRAAFSCDAGKGLAFIRLEKNMALVR